MQRSFQIKRLHIRDDQLQQYTSIVLVATAQQSITAIIPIILIVILNDILNVLIARLHLALLIRTLLMFKLILLKTKTIFDCCYIVMINRYMLEANTIHKSSN